MKACVVVAGASALMLAACGKLDDAQPMAPRSLMLLKVLPISSGVRV